MFLHTSEDVTASYRQPRRFYGAPTTCNSVSTEFYSAIDCAFSEYPPSAHNVLRVFTSRVLGVLCGLIACTRRALVIVRLMLICTILKTKMNFNFTTY